MNGASERLDFGGTLLAIYLGTSPVYWFASIPVPVISAIKYVLVMGAVAVIWVRAVRSGKASLPFDLAGPPGFIFALGVMTTGFLQSDVQTVASVISDVALAFVFMWTVYLYVRNGGSAIGVLRLASIVILPLCALVVSAGVLGVPAWESPFLGYPYTIADSGLGGVRTGWSVGVSLFLPICLFTADQLGRTSPFRGMLFALLSVMLIIGSQLVTGGRSGLLASMSVLAVWQLLRPTRRWIWLLPVLAGGLIALDWSWVILRLRVDGLLAGLTYEQLETFSSGRLDVYAAAIEAFLARPLTGFGFDRLGLSEIPSSTIIHNGWLRLGVEAGLPGVLGHFAMVVVFAKRCLFVYTNAKRADHPATGLEAMGLAIVLVLVALLVCVMFEPYLLFGTFQLKALLFAAVGIGSAYASQRGASDVDRVGGGSVSLLRSVPQKERV